MKVRKEKRIPTHPINIYGTLPSAVFIISQLVYNSFHESGSIFWAIFYFGSIYLVLFLWTVIEFMRAKDYLNKLYYIGFGMSLYLLFYLEVKSRNAKVIMTQSDYEAYMDLVNSKENTLLFSLFILVVMVTILTRLWKK